MHLSWEEAHAFYNNEECRTSILSSLIFTAILQLTLWSWLCQTCKRTNLPSLLLLCLPLPSTAFSFDTAQLKDHLQQLLWAAGSSLSLADEISTKVLSEQDELEEAGWDFKVYCIKGDLSQAESGKLTKAMRWQVSISGSETSTAVEWESQTPGRLQ